MTTMTPSFDPTTSFDPGMMTPTSSIALWEGSTADLTNLATGGRMTVASYRITEDGIVFASGVLSTREEVVPLWAVRDVDLTQRMTQKARGVGDLTLKIDESAAPEYGQQKLVLKSIADPQNVKRLILDQANKVRLRWNAWRQEQTIERNRAGAAQVFAGQLPTTGSADDLMVKLTKLGDMKQAGLLTDEEFAAAKAKLLGG